MMSVRLVGCELSVVVLVYPEISDRSSNSLASQGEEKWSKHGKLSGKPWSLISKTCWSFDLYSSLFSNWQPTKNNNKRTIKTIKQTIYASKHTEY